MLGFCESAGRGDVQVHRHRDEVRADRHRRGHRRAPSARTASGVLATSASWCSRCTSRWSCSCCVVLRAGGAHRAGSAARVLAVRSRSRALIAFTTASSEAALPLAMENMEKFGVPRRIVSFVMPTGYSFNLDGIDALSGGGVDLRGAGRGRAPRPGPAAGDDADADAHEQRRRRGAARVAGDSVRDAGARSGCRSKASRSFSAWMSSWTWRAPRSIWWATASPRRSWPAGKASSTPRRRSWACTRYRRGPRRGTGVAAPE